MLDKYFKNSTKENLEIILNEGNFDNEIIIPQIKEDIPGYAKSKYSKDGYMVYILAFKNKAIVTGHGKKDRSKIICDNINTSTHNHYKSLMVRCYLISKETKEEDFTRFIIRCNSKEKAKEIENYLHKEIGGTGTELPDSIDGEFTSKYKEADLIVKLARASKFSGMSDLKTWKESIIDFDKNTWGYIYELFQLDKLTNFK